MKTFPVIGKYRFGWMMMLVLVVAFIVGLVTGLTNSIWRLSPSWLIPLGLCAITAGWYAGGTKRLSSIYFGMGIISGIILLVLLQSEAYQDFFRAFSEAQKTQIIFQPLYLNLPNSGPMAYHLFSAVSNLNAYILDLSQWFYNLLHQKSGPNLTAINLLWRSMLWLVLFTKGWLLRRQTHAFLASLPALTLLCGVMGFTRRDSTGLIITLGTVFGLMILTEILKREHRWEIQHVDYSEEIRFDIITYSIPVLALILALAGIIPSISLDNIRSLFNLQNRIIREEHIDISTALGLDQVPLDPIFGSSQGGMPRSHLIGSGAELSGIIIMEISPGEFYLPPQVDPMAPLPSDYWFGHAYDEYTGSGWISDDLQRETIPADQQLQGNEWPANRVVQHTVRKTDAASNALYFSGMLKSVNRTITLFSHEATHEFTFGQLTAKQYQVNTAVYDISEEQLRQSKADPPETIQTTYLQLPPEIPTRVDELARNLTGQANTPYEKAKAIETYLRQFDYTLDLPAPPQNRDIVDYFLFELQKGYCDYYASAMVVLARLSGLPARFVVGYGPGTYDYNQQQYIVTEANAHAWPEIYFEPVGWVPFEPTASFSLRDWRPETESLLSSSPAYPSADPQNGAVKTLVHPAWSIPLLVIFIVGLWWLVLSRRRKHASTSTQIESIYQSTRAHMTQLFVKFYTETTPQEFGLAYVEFLQSENCTEFTKKISHRIITNLTTIINLYEIGVYSPHQLMAEQVEEARKNLIILRFRSWLLKAARIIK